MLIIVMNRSHRLSEYVKELGLFAGVGKYVETELLGGLADGRYFDLNKRKYVKRHDVGEAENFDGLDFQSDTPDGRLAIKKRK